MSKGLPKTVKKVYEKLHFYKAWLAMMKGDIMSTSKLQRHFKSHSSIQSSIQSFSLLNLQLQIVSKDNIKIRLILIIFLFIQELWFFITSTWFPPLISIKHICYLQLIFTKYDFFFIIIISILHLWTIYLWVPGNLKGLQIFTMNNIIE